VFDACGDLPFVHQVALIPTEVPLVPLFLSPQVENLITLLHLIKKFHAQSFSDDESLILFSSLTLFLSCRVHGLLLLVL
jgi:hypothetical protein